MNNLDPQQVANAIGWPVLRWPSNCYAVAVAIQEAGLVRGSTRYGLYHGHIDPMSIFGSRTFTHHGWIERRQTIYDPTRWVFENVAPYIYVGPKDDKDYDFGGNYIRKLYARPCPAYIKKKSYVAPVELRPFIKLWMGKMYYGDGMIGGAQTIWLANLPLNILGDRARPLYEWICDKDNGVGLPGFIPMDNRNLIMRDI